MMNSEELAFDFVQKDVIKNYMLVFP